MDKLSIEQMKALSNEHRVKILNIIHQGNGCLCYVDIYKEMKMPNQTFNYHVKKLENAKIIKSKRVRQKKIVVINYQVLETLNFNFSKMIKSFS